MSKAGSKDYELQIRAMAVYPSSGAWKPDVVPFLLRLLDAERARADAAEAAAEARTKRLDDVFLEGYEAGLEALSDHL